MTIFIQGTTDPLLEQGTSEAIFIQGGGATVKPPVVKLEPGDLGATNYPSFFPCATWEYSQGISANMTPTPFTSGWTRYRRRWRENVSSVNLEFEMKTSMFDRWATWMTKNGYDWFTMPLDRFGGKQVVSEVRLVTPIQWEYRTHDNVVCSAGGELGAPGYGPQEGPLEGDTDFGNFCVGAYTTNQWQDYDQASAGAQIAYNVVIGSTVTQPVEYTWYASGVLIPGETGASYTYTVPTPDDPRIGDEYEVSVNVTNPCGSQWLRSKITVPPDTACEPYACDALLIDMVSVEGTGAWDLLDGNDEPVVPTLWDQKSSYLPGVGLTSSDSGNNWGSSTGISRTTLEVGNDLDLCEGPYCATNGWNSQGTPSSWRLTPQPNWGSTLPNASIAVVARSIEARDIGGVLANHLWRGTTDIRTYQQLGTPTTVSIQQDIRCGVRTVDSVQYDALWFNYLESPSERRWALLLPLGTFRGGDTLLIEATLSVDDIQYVASASQPSFARYDMRVTTSYFGSVTNVTTGETWSDSNSVTWVATITHESHSNPALPLSDSRTPFFLQNGTPACQYLQGGWGACYNLSVRHKHGGEGPDALIKSPGIPGRISSGLGVSVFRNFADYEQPEYCNT